MMDLLYYSIIGSHFLNDEIRMVMLQVALLVACVLASDISPIYLSPLLDPSML